MMNKKLFVVLAATAAIVAPVMVEEVKAATKDVSLQDYLSHWGKEMDYYLISVYHDEDHKEIIEPETGTFRISEKDLNRTYEISFSRDGYDSTDIWLGGTMDDIEIIELDYIYIDMESGEQIRPDAKITKSSPDAGYVEMRRGSHFLVEKPFPGMLIELSDGNVLELREEIIGFSKQYSAWLTDKRIGEPAEAPYRMTEIAAEDVKVVSDSSIDVEISPTEVGGVIVFSQDISNDRPVKVQLPSGQPGESLFLSVHDGGSMPVAYSEKDGIITATIHQIGMLHYKESPPAIKDSKGSSFEAYIDKLASRGIIEPDSSGKFQPSRVIKRYEFAEMLGKALGLAGGMYTKFEDLTIFPAQAYIIALHEMGIINGQSETIFGEQGDLTRQQGFAILGRYLEKLGYEVDSDAEAIKGFQDYEEVSRDMRPYIALLVELGAVQGKGGNLIDPHSAFTRGQMTKVLSTILEKEGLL